MPSKSASDDLISLINGLSKSEKRYFKLHAAAKLQQGDSVYLALYEHLLAAGEWSESAIRRAFAGQRFLSQLVVARTRLQGMLLDALRDYDRRLAHRLDVSERMDAIDVTFRRKQFALCARLVHAALKHMAELDLPLETLRLIEWAMRLERILRPADLHARLDAWHAQYAQALHHVRIEAEVRQAYDEMAKYLPTRAGQSSHVAGAIQGIMELPAMRLPIDTLPFDARLMRIYIASFHALIRGEMAQHRSHLEHIVRVWQSSPARMRCQEENYFEALAACADSALVSSDSAENEKVAAKSKRLVGRSSRLQLHERHRLLYQELMLAIHRDQWQVAAAMIPEVQAVLKQRRGNVPAPLRLGLVSNVVTVLYYAQRWREVLEWAQRLEAELDGQVVSPWEELLRAWRWVAWYETGAHDALERGLQRLRPSDAEEAAAPQFIALLQSGSPQAETQAFSALRSVLRTQAQEELPLHKSMLEVWALARIHNVDMSAAERLRSAP